MRNLELSEIISVAGGSRIRPRPDTDVRDDDHSARMTEDNESGGSFGGSMIIVASGAIGAGFGGVVGNVPGGVYGVIGGTAIGHGLAAIYENPEAVAAAIEGAYGRAGDQMAQGEYIGHLQPSGM